MTIDTILNDVFKVVTPMVETVAEFSSIELVIGACVGFIGYAAYRSFFGKPGVTRTYCGI